MTIGNAEDWRFFYNADGLRTRRYENNWGKHYTYDYNSSGQLVRMNVRTEDYNGANYYNATLTFTYDANGTPLSMTVNYIEYVFEPYYDEYWGYEEWDYMPYYYSGTFYYVTNAQGDVIALLNQSGNKVMEYVYDAWGNVLYSSRHYMAELNPLLYRGYVYDSETGLYYLQSRYYDPEIGRFINADAFVATGQGFVGNNMFAYCLNNPVNFLDRSGKNAEALQWWSGGMWWLCGADTVLPIGDIVYVGGVIVLGVIALATSQDNTPEIVFDEADITYGSPSPNNNDDDDDDDNDYYDDDSNFGGRQKIGKSKGSTPGNNQKQNKQFKDATKELTQDQQRVLHDQITGKGLGFHEIVEDAKSLVAFVISVLTLDD